MRQSVLERIVKERVAYTTVGTVSVALDRLAEELAREVLADEEFRQSFHALIRAAARDIMNELQRREARRTSRAKRGPRRDRLS